ncbi:MAG: mannose-6-phosphate isomerase, class I, partial [Ignavibacteriae bacterium]|nr:mannose-6-phosphate isomerase, class I [Ignavibacteriota bacterium]
MIKPQPYKILPKIQHYEWGTKNRKALIPRFLGIKPESNLPYAELWFGTHPKSPSDILIENETYSLSEIIKKYPNEILGEKVSKKFSSTLPFLLKILSIEKALSIQTHPNKNVAKDLHKNDPKNYPDSNHKPEIAIAIDKLNAIVGLQSLENIKNSFIKYPQLNLLLNKEVEEKLFSANARLNQDFVKEVYSEIMNASDRKIKICVNSLLELISQKNKKTQIEKQFLVEFKNYGFDVGLISLLLFNFIQLKKDEAIFTKAGIPHAYLGGNIV